MSAIDTSMDSATWLRARLGQGNGAPAPDPTREWLKQRLAVQSPPVPQVGAIPAGAVDPLDSSGWNSQGPAGPPAPVGATNPFDPLSSGDTRQPPQPGGLLDRMAQSRAMDDAAKQAGFLGRTGAAVQTAVGSGIDASTANVDRLLAANARPGDPTFAPNSQGSKMMGVTDRTRGIAERAGPVSNLIAQTAAFPTAFLDPVAMGAGKVVEGAGSAAVKGLDPVQALLAGIESKAGPKAAGVVEKILGGSAGGASFAGLHAAASYPNWAEDPVGGIHAVSEAVGSGVVAGGVFGGAESIPGLVRPGEAAPEAPKPNAPAPMPGTIPRARSVIQGAETAKGGGTRFVTDGQQVIPLPENWFVWDPAHPADTIPTGPSDVTRPQSTTQQAGIPDAYKPATGAAAQTVNAARGALPVEPGVDPQSRGPVVARPAQVRPYAPEAPPPDERPTIPLQGPFDPTQNADRGPWQERQGFRVQGQDVPRLPPPGSWHDVSGETATTPSPGFAPERLTNSPKKSGSVDTADVSTGQPIIKPNDANAVPRGTSRPPQQMSIPALRAEIQGSPYEVEDVEKMDRPTLVRTVKALRTMPPPEDVSPSTPPPTQETPDAVRTVRQGQQQPPVPESVNQAGPRDQGQVQEAARARAADQGAQGDAPPRVQPGTGAGGGEQGVSEAQGRDVPERVRLLKDPRSMTNADLRAELANGPNEIVNLNSVPRPTLVKAVNAARAEGAKAPEEGRPAMPAEKQRVVPTSEPPYIPDGVKPPEESKPPLIGMGAASMSPGGDPYADWNTDAKLTQAVEHRAVLDQAPRGIADRFRKLGDQAKEFWRYYSNKTAPTITAANREAGEATARYMAVPESVHYRTEAMKQRVFGTTNADAVRKDPNYSLAGKLVLEDNLRDIGNHLRYRAGEALAQGDKAGADRLMKEAATVRTTVGEGGAFENEQAYIKAGENPDALAYIKKYGNNMNPWMDQRFKEAKGLAPDEDLPTRGEKFGVRVNLMRADPEDPTPGVVPLAGVRRGDLGAPRNKGAAFDSKATGGGEAYSSDLIDMMTNSIARATKPARLRGMYDALVKGGVAFYADKRADSTVVDGKRYVPEDIRGNPKSAPGKYIYVREDAYPEFRRALQADQPTEIPVLTPLLKLANSFGISGTSEAVKHAANIGSWFMQTEVRGKGPIGKLAEGADWLPGANVTAGPILRGAMLLGKAYEVLSGKNPENLDRLASMADEGAVPKPHGGSKFNPLSYGGKALDVLQQSARLLADESFSEGVKRGEFKDTDTNRRDMVNAMGQYIRGAQGQLVRVLKDTGLSPFLTAYKTSAAMTKSMVTLDPGVETNTTAQAAVLRAKMAMRLASPFVLVGLANLKTTGKVAGRPGVPVGAYDTGENDKDGNPIYSDALLKYNGIRKALKMTGADAALLELKRGLGGTKPVGAGTIASNMGDAAWRQAADSAIGGVAGPGVRDVFTGLTGRRLSANMPRVTEPQKTFPAQAWENTKAAVQLGNPATSAYRSFQEKGSLPDALKEGLLGDRPPPNVSPKREADHQQIIDAVHKNDVVDFLASKLRGIKSQTERLSKMNAELEAMDATPAEKARIRRDLLVKKRIMAE